MWKVMIADDEPKIRRGLRSTIENMGSEMAVIAETEDGEQALAAVRAEHPDILLIDIRMPFLNGLELIERIREITLDCVIVVVTGHDEFEYAKRALQLKVFDFLLKPVSEEQLSSVLARARQELSSMRSQNRYVAWAREQLERNLVFLRESFMRSWVSGKLSHSEIDEQLAFLDLKIGQVAGMIVARVCERPGGARLLAERDRALVLLAIRGIIEETLDDFAPVCTFQDNYDNVVALCGSAGGERWLDSLPRIRAKAANAEVQTLILAQKTMSGGPDAVPEAYESLIAEIAFQSENSAIVQRVHAYLEENYFRGDLSLEQTSSAMKLSAGYLSRVLKQQSGLSFIDYLTRLRVAKAAQLMIDPAVKIYEVAESVGFSSQHYFSRAFKRVFGIPPVDYRKGGVA